MGGVYDHSHGANCHFETKQTLLRCAFVLVVCAQGEVVEFIDEFLDEDENPTLEGPPIQ